METTTCPLCARPRSAADARGLAWSGEHGPGGTASWICPECTRDRLMEIETQLALFGPDSTDPRAA